MSIKTRLCLIVVIMILVVLLGQSLVVYFQSKTNIEDLVSSAATNEARQYAQIIDTWIRGKGDKLSVLVLNDVIRNMNWQDQLPLLNEIIAEEDDIEAIFISDLNGQARSSTGEVVSIRDRNYFQEAVKTGRITYSQPMMSRFSGANTVVVAQPIERSGEIVGVLGVTLLLDHLQTLVQEMKISGYGYGWIIDAEGNTVAHPDERYLGNQDVFIGHDELSSLAEEMKKGNSGLGFYHFNGVSKGLAYAPIPVVGWSIAMTADTADIIAPATKLRNESIIITGIAVLIGVVISFMVAQYIVNPLIKFKDQVQQIAAGDLTIEIDTTGNDEIGQLGDALRTMTRNLRELIGAVNDAVGHINTSASQLNANCEESAASAEQTSATLNKVAAAVQKVVSDIELISQSSDDTARQTAEGSRGAALVTEQMSNIAESSKRVGESLKALHDQAQEINRVLALINSFADQTNLLALNATIEAARAGEAGLGFAVVADEVRKLAEQSAKATSDIQKLLVSIQNVSQDAVSLMQVSEGAVAEGSEVIQTVGSRFFEIDEVIQKLNQQFEQILSAAQQMASSIEEITAASQEQTAMSEEVASATDQLSQLSQNLNDLVRQFKV